MARRFHEETLSALQMRGQDFYRQKQYEAALQCFNEMLSVNQDTKALVAILDNRAATYAKLGNLRAALSDGTQMIRQEKANCLGYLRTGKILQLMGQREVALQLYEMGTRKVPSSDSNIMSLREQHEKLTRQLAPAKAIDPLQMLPLELAVMMFNYLEFRHIVGLLRVSKTWLQLLASIPGLWSDLDFSTAKKPVNLGAIRKYIKRGNGTTTRVTLDRFGSNAEKIPRYVATRCRGLKELRMSGGLIGASILEAVLCASSLQSLIISKSCTISGDVVSQLLSNCPNLERAEFQSVSSAGIATVWDVDMPKLRTLALDFQKPAKGRPPCVLVLETLLTRIPNIHTLSVQGWTLPLSSLGEPTDFSNLHQLQHLDISRLRAILPPRLPLSIRTIAMADCGTLRSHRFSFVDLDLSQMVRLSLKGWSELSLSDLQACLLPSKGKVTHLNISGCVNLSSADLKELITQGYLEGVEDFALRTCNVDDEVAILTARNLPHLKKLDIACCSKITGVGVKAFLTGLGGKLEHLCLDGCHCTNIDAVQLARAMGVKVSFAFKQFLTSGRHLLQR